MSFQMLEICRKLFLLPLMYDYQDSFLFFSDEKNFYISLKGTAVLFDSIKLNLRNYLFCSSGEVVIFVRYPFAGLSELFELDFVLSDHRTRVYVRCVSHPLLREGIKWLGRGCRDWPVWGERAVWFSVQTRITSYFAYRFEREISLSIGGVEAIFMTAGWRQWQQSYPACRPRHCHDTQIVRLCPRRNTHSSTDRLYSFPSASAE